MDKMNSFSDVGAKSSKDIEKQKTDNISKIELLVACYVESLPEDRQKCILNLANVLHNAGSNAIKQDIEVDIYTLLRNLKDFQNGFNKFLEEEVAAVFKKEGLFKSNNSKVINTSEAPIQNKYGLLHFRQVDVVSPSYNIKLDNDKVYSVDVYSEKSRNICIKQLKEDTGINFTWLHEIDAKKHRILYDTKMYYVDKAGYFSYDERNTLIPLIPLNGTSCYLMFACLQNLTTIDFSHFCTNNVITMELMFNYSEKLNTLDLSSFDTSSVTDMNFMFCDCKSLTQLNLSSFSTENVKYLNSMFENCVSLWKLDLSSFSTKSAMHFTKTFAGCENLYHIDVSYKWILNEDAENNEVFNDCYRLPHYRDSRLGTEMFCSVNEGGYFHYVGEEDDYE